MSELRHWHGYTLLCEPCDLAWSTDATAWWQRIGRRMQAVKRDHDATDEHRENVKRGRAESVTGEATE